MACFFPLEAFSYPKPSGEGFWVWFGKPPSDAPAVVRGSSFLWRPLKLPCGQCIGCRLKRGRDWAIRCFHESKCHSTSSFLTLTYSDEYLPPGATLVRSDFQRFLKRLRKKVGKVRFYMCAEYGPTTQRPHYHAIIFGYDFPDKVLWKTTKSGSLFVSSELADLWPFGFHTVAEVSFDTVTYVTHYILKKVLGKAAEAAYAGREPEFSSMSLRPGIGQAFFDSHPQLGYQDFVEVLRKDGSHYSLGLPRYYRERFRLDSPLAAAKLLERRIEVAKGYEILPAAHEVLAAKLLKKKRTL